MNCWQSRSLRAQLKHSKQNCDPIVSPRNAPLQRPRRPAPHTHCVQLPVLTDPRKDYIQLVQMLRQTHSFFGSRGKILSHRMRDSFPNSDPAIQSLGKQPFPAFVTGAPGPSNRPLGRTCDRHKPWIRWSKVLIMAPHTIGPHTHHVKKNLLQEREAK